jgi:APA family basic amino acid/polyamine antiporter
MRKPGMQLNRRLGLGDALLLIIGNVIGAGIFTTSGFLAGELPDPWLFLGIWLIGGVLTICGALTYAELAGMYPRSGGDYQFLKEAFGPWAGFLLGWVAFWIINPGSIAALSIALASYVKSALPLFDGCSVALLAGVLILVFTAINWLGIRPGGITQNLFAVGTMVVLGLLILAGLLAPGADWGLLTAAAPVSVPWTRLFGGPMIAVLFTFSGWFAAAYVGGEIINPQRNLPRALILGSLAVTIIYLLINLVYVTALPLSQLAGATNVAQVTVQALYGPVVARWVSLPIILAIAAGINATVMTGSRVAYAMGRDGLLSLRLGHLHPVYRTPTVALACQALLAIILLLLGTFDQLLSYVVAVMVLSCLACGLALFVLRWRRPEHPRLYRAWGYPLVPLLFMGSYLLILVRITADRPGPALLGILMTLSGLPVYLYQRQRRKGPSPEPAAGQAATSTSFSEQ